MNQRQQYKLDLTDIPKKEWRKLIKETGGYIVLDKDNTFKLVYAEVISWRKQK